MILISHRGNIDSVKPERENTSEYIQEAIDAGYDVEIDVRYISGKLYLGHDTPDYEIELEWLQRRNLSLWVHTKNFEALSYLIDKNLRVFYHQKEDHTIINNCNLIWSHNVTQANHKSIIPLLDRYDIEEADVAIEDGLYGICSDYVGLIKI